MKKGIAKMLLGGGFPLFLLILPLLLAGCGSGNFGEYELAGNWYIYQTSYAANTPEVVHTVAIDMATQTNSFGMTWLTNATNGDAYTSGGGSEDSSGNISFTMEDTNTGITYTFTGTSNSASTMVGTWTSNNGQSGVWNALNQQPVFSGVNFAGEWKASYTGDNTGLPVLFTLNQPDANTVTSIDNSISGNINEGGGTPHIVFYLTDSGNTDVYVFTGTLTAAGAMSGAWENSAKEAGTWSAIINTSSP